MSAALDLLDPAESRGEAPGRDRLRGRRVLVVGAGTAGAPGDAIGNGQAIAELAAREGATVVCLDRDEDALEATVTAIGVAGGSAHPLLVDIADADACGEVPARAAELAGGLDGIVFGVGALTPFGLAETAPAAWDRAFATNVRSHALIATAALPRLPDGASLVFLASISSHLPGIGMPAYDTTKAAVLGLMRHVALEAAPRRIRANAVLPGVVDTPLGAATAPADAGARNRLSLPLGRRASPWDVAHATVFLLSGEAAYVTGQELVVDGGLTALRLGV